MIKLRIIDHFLRWLRRGLRHLLLPVVLDITMHQQRIWGPVERLHIGDGVELNSALINTVSGEVTIGDNTFLGHDVALLTGTHDLSGDESLRADAVCLEGNDIVIGKNVWICSRAVILGGCRIGDGAVIGAGAVVTRDVSSGLTVVGVPAKPIKGEGCGSGEV